MCHTYRVLCQRILIGLYSNDLQDGGDCGSNTSEALVANVQCTGYILRKLREAVFGVHS